jgi:hypothetical protein
MNIYPAFAFHLHTRTIEMLLPDNHIADFWLYCIGMGRTGILGYEQVSEMRPVFLTVMILLMADHERESALKNTAVKYCWFVVLL